MSIALVSRDNGVGLSADMDLLAGMLGGMGHRVTRVDWTAPMMPRVDVAMFLELWSKRLARCAMRRVGIFNLEWFERRWAADLPRLDQLWAKSVACHGVLARRGLRSTYTGFLARDLRNDTPSTLSCLHIRGHSDLKNTEAVLDAWRLDPSLPPLTVISEKPLNAPPHVRVLGRVTQDVLIQELNAAAIHVCPSEAEGWGHYIAEGLSTGAIVVTLNGSPMSEHVQPAWGVLIQPRGIGSRGYYAATYQTSGRDIAIAVRSAAAASPEARAIMATRARAHFEKRNNDFRVIATDLLARL